MWKHMKNIFFMFASNIQWPSGICRLIGFDLILFNMGRILLITISLIFHSLKICGNLLIDSYRHYSDRNWQRFFHTFCEIKQIQYSFWRGGWLTAVFHNKLHIVTVMVLFSIYMGVTVNCKLVDCVTEQWG